MSLLLTIPDIHKLYSVDQFPSREVLHQCEGEPFAAQVLERCPYVVDLVVDKQEAVVSAVEGVDRDGCILRIVALEVELQLLADVAGVYGGRHAAVALVEQGEHGVVDIVVNKHEAVFALRTRSLAKR